MITMRTIKSYYLGIAALAFLIVFPVFAAVTINATFAELYPDPWWSTGWGIAIVSVGVAIATAGAIAFTVATAGTGGAMLGAAGGWITAVGSTVGMAAGYGSGAAAAGLALLGGGTLATGGFGIAGGAFVVAALTGVATGVVTDMSLDAASKIIINEPYRRYEFIKVPLVEKRGSKEVRKLVEELREIEETAYDNDENKGGFESETRRVSGLLVERLMSACSKPEENKEALYDAINGAILSYNLGNDQLANKCIKLVEASADNRSFLNYLSALNLLTQGDYESAKTKLYLSINNEPDALQPYILYNMVLTDQGDYRRALEISEKGLDNVSKNNYQLLYSAGESAFRLEDFEEAAKYFEKAYSNVSESLIEADTAMMVAVSYHKAGDSKLGWVWYEKALKKLGKDNEENKAAITKRWNEIVG